MTEEEATAYLQILSVFVFWEIERQRRECRGGKSEGSEEEPRCRVYRKLPAILQPGRRVLFSQVSRKTSSRKCKKAGRGKNRPLPASVFHRVPTYHCSDFSFGFVLEVSRPATLKTIREAALQSADENGNGEARHCPKQRFNAVRNRQVADQSNDPNPYRC